MTEGKQGLFVRATRVDQTSSEKTQVELYPGDTIEYGITHQVELPDRTSMWVKVNSTTSIQPHETAREAADRLAGLVGDQIKYRILQAVSDAGDIHL
jgi:hypothetical protein